MRVLRGFGESGKVICGSSGGVVGLRKAKEVMPDDTSRGEDPSAGAAARDQPQDSPVIAR